MGYEEKAEKECARCGACTAVCPVYRATGREFYTARGRRHLHKIAGDESGRDVQDIFSKCLLCGACAKVCPRDIDSPAYVRAVRSRISKIPGGYKKYVVGRVLERPQLLTALCRAGQRADSLLSHLLPAESGLRFRLAMIGDEQLEDGGQEQVKLPAGLKPLIYFPGCATQHVTPDLLRRHQNFLAHYGYELQVPEDLACCGLSAFSAGDALLAERLAQQNIEIFEKSSGPILVSCASCYYQLHFLAKLFTDSSWRQRAEAVASRVLELSQFLMEQGSWESDIADVDPVRVFYHDPCHFRNELEIKESPRTLLRNCPGVKLVELPGGGECCGMGGLFSLDAMKLSGEIRDNLAAKVLALQPDFVISSCSGCLMQWRSAMAVVGAEVPVLHLTDFLARYHS